VFYLWPAREFIKKLLVLGKRARGICNGQQVPLSISPHIDLRDVLTVTVAVVKSQATIVKGQLGSVSVDLMLDSGLSVSLVQCDILSSIKNIVDAPQARLLRLVTAPGDQLPILRQIRAKVQLGELDAFHDFMVVKKLVTSVILGIDFL